MIQPAHFNTLAKCRPIHQISIEFQNIDNNQGFPTKNNFFPFKCHNLAIHEVTSIEIFSKHYWQSKVQDLMIGSRKISFHFEHWPTCQYVHSSTCFKPNIHQNGPEILGVNYHLLKGTVKTTGMVHK